MGARWRSASAGVMLTLVVGGVSTGMAADPTPSDPAASPAASVLTYRGDVGRSGVMPGPGPVGTPGIAWTFQAKAPMVALTLAEGVVHAVSRDGVLHALELATGAERWSVPLGAEVNAPSIIVDDLVIVGDRAGRLHARARADGAERWIVTLDGPISGGPASVDGELLVGTEAGTLVALDPRTGTLLWSTDLGGAIHRSPAVTDGVAYVGVAPATLVAVSTVDGTERWRRSIADDGILMTPVVAGSTVHASLNKSRTGLLVAFDARTGQERWRRPSAGSAAFYPPVATDAALLIGDREGLIASLDPGTGAIGWSVTVPQLLGTPSFADGVVYDLSTSGRLLALDAATGETRWQLPMRGDAASILIADRHVLVATSLGQVHAVTGDGS